MNPANGWSAAAPPSPKYFRLSQLRKLRESEQIAAVCYRVGNGGIEFLLVQTRGGRWTFPKGRVEPGLTHAQAAALEAYEEAGVHGRMEETSFTRYYRRTSGARAASKRQGIDAHLCEVLRLERPPESDRNPTWFSAAGAKRRLREDRARVVGEALGRVIDCALARIQHLNTAAAPIAALQRDGLQRVQFEAAESQTAPLDFTPYRRTMMGSAMAVELAMKGYLPKTLQSSASRRLNPIQLARVVEINDAPHPQTKRSFARRKPNAGA